jgi:phosphoribosylformylglycinamidine (FGAM) synthase-like enzyme
MNLTNQDPEDDHAELSEVAESEQEYLHERLRRELGREPTDVELDEWLRQHTEGY